MFDHQVSHFARLFTHFRFVYLVDLPGSRHHSLIHLPESARYRGTKLGVNAPID
jgi:hypothetical protein